MRIVFILGSVTDSHQKNRIEEFIQNGFDVKVYGFRRNGHELSKCLKYPIEILGDIEDGSYKQRLPIYYNSFKSFTKRHNDGNVIYYMFGQDLTFFFTLLNKGVKYIYEEADLVHSYFPTKVQRALFEYIDKRIINKSLITVLTSDGFVKFHFGDKKPENVIVIPNRLNPSILNLKFTKSRKFDKKNISIGFVGWPRFNSVVNFIDVFCSKYPNYHFHVFGAPISNEFQALTKYPNYHLHGRFQNPIDLPEIYSSIDMVLSTYDVEFENVRYAEPNKIYEAMFFETPIIVSKGTFLAEKIETLGIGYAINALDSDEICSFIDNLTFDSIESRIENEASIDKRDTVNINEDFFRRLKDAF